ncbi:hypothetical protein M431DRAFT_386678 [Trichoderma harzianum CBS 226.95]|uniref:Protein kish n=1 Tax=Trichoderma harzianum CBS 226.95 TaxID=983964 RepID=A0A2T4AI97_TRIHA|nr:hypothetical protein M431DRAFT_386678 [Trichoderma harzianum CBS 226.95]PTB56799.1 hypothetical protein M431DRAFT_386678 [Trichoderma harzianum CBS 226.95]
MSALFNFKSLLLVILLLICTSTYVHHFTPGIMDRNKNGVMGIFWKCARIGERLSPYISICCVIMAVRVHAAQLIRSTHYKRKRKMETRIVIWKHAF